jgi:hypothetical protein
VRQLKKTALCVKREYVVEMERPLQFAAEAVFVYTKK